MGLGGRWSSLLSNEKSLDCGRGAWWRLRRRCGLDVDRAGLDCPFCPSMTQPEFSSVSRSWPLLQMHRYRVYHCDRSLDRFDLYLRETHE